MRAKDISQLPVFERGKCVGSLSDALIVDLVAEHTARLREMKVRDAMRESFPVIPANSLIDVVSDLLRHYRAVLVEKNGHVAGILTRADLFKAI
jgi:predicted transcriptional regulator